ncbi:hypothetical protein A8L59_16620 [Pseudomonas koreensis]|uniref:Lipoprotein n=1 Tax=Pseudomonas koreensis TaxID=198620 RepID=A0AAC9BWF9_9PSED|nr:hypothetical protein [Pseudomonas koreensis]ANH98970.1 hypothetical protein A8L59_16620 [Pseudomonas koreensis]
MKRLVCAVALGAVLTGCGNTEREQNQRLQGEVSRLEKELAVLRAELDAERNGPDRLLARARNEAERSARAQAKSTLEQLISRYPESSQAKDAKILLSGIDAAMSAELKAKQEEEKRRLEEKAKALAQLDSKLQKNTDEIEGITWISHANQPVLDTYISLYFGTKDGKVGNYPLRMKLNYYADSWLFVEGVTIKADDQTYNLNHLSFERDNGSGSIWEWSDSAVLDKAMIDKIIGSKKVIVRFNGKQYYHDLIVPEAQKKAMADMVAAWERYGGKA